MTEPRRITSEDLALFAMQLLSKEETAEVSAYLAQSNDARRWSWPRYRATWRSTPIRWTCIRLLYRRAND